MKDQKLSRMVVDMTLSRTAKVPAAIQLRILEACFSRTSLLLRITNTLSRQ